MPSTAIREIIVIIFIVFIYLSGFTNGYVFGKYFDIDFTRIKNLFKKRK